MPRQNRDVLVPNLDEGSSSLEGWRSLPSSSPYLSAIIFVFPLHLYIFRRIMDIHRLGERLKKKGVIFLLLLYCKKLSKKKKRTTLHFLYVAGRPFKYLRSVSIHWWQRMLVAFKALMMVLQMVLLFFHFYVRYWPGWKKWGGARRSYERQKK